MKQGLFLFVLIILSSINASQAFDLNHPKSQVLLDDIRRDISDSLSQIMDIESSDWNVYLRKPKESYIFLGVIVEPSSKTILSVSSHGLANTLGLKVGDVLESISLNGKRYQSNFLKLKATGGDKVSAIAKRGPKELKLDTVVTHDVTPHWQLIASPNADFVVGDENHELNSQRLQSKDSIVILEKLQSRINTVLGDIQRLEAESDNSKFEVSLSQQSKSQTRFGVTIDRTTNKVIRIDEGSNAYSLNLQPGDFIKGVKVNGKVMESVSSLSLSDGDELEVSIERGSQLLNLTTQVQSKEIPAWKFFVQRERQYSDSACGVVTLLLTPQISEDIYNVEASQLNGDNIISSRVIFKLKPGTHSFKLYDQIPSERVVSSFRKRRAYKIGKTFELKIEPNKRYYLASKFDRTKRWKTKDGEYWKPMVWKVEDYECSL